MTFKRTMCALLAASMLTTAAISTQSAASAAEIQAETSDAPISAEVSKDYGLADNIQDGVILHCFCWKYNDIKAMLPEIAEAGFTSIQTSPAQRDSSFGVWYMMYQPQGFSISTNALGTKEDLTSLCEEADKYGIKIVVDVVANHMRGDGNDVDSNMQRNSHPDLWHGGGGIDYNDRYSITHGDLGMRDLNSEHSEVQRVVAEYIDELKSVGVDGCRWDAAKHIGLPSESCEFWPKVTAQGLWHYGEILDSPGGDGASLMKEYTNYISVTDGGNDGYCAKVRNAFNGGGTPGVIGNWSERGVSKDKLVYWGESHDDYSNNGDYGVATQFMDQNVIDRAYAVLASQNKATALYFSRPFSTDKESIMAGAKGSTHFTSKEVAAVNHFHNAMVGTKEYYVNGGSAAAVCREGGAVVVKGSGSGHVEIENGGGTVAPGTYTDEVTGNTWTVTSSTISGDVGDTGIAVFYNGGPVSGASVSANPSDTSFTTDTLSITLSLKGADNGSYTTSEGDSGSFVNGDKITIGSKTNATGTAKTITVTLKATGEDGKEVSKTFTYTKTDPSLKTCIYFDNSSYNWSNVYAYVYDESVTPKVEPAAWPGVKLSQDSATGYYKYELPDNVTAKGQVIFSDGSGSASNRYPADQEPGLVIGSTSKLFSANHAWNDYAPPVNTDTDTDTSTDSDTDSDTTVTVLSGDATQDGKVNLRDASMVQKAVAGSKNLTGKAKLAADVDGNDKLTASDAVAIQRYDIDIASYSIGKNVERKL